jgi:hypothetical protein
MWPDGGGNMVRRTVGNRVLRQGLGMVFLGALLASGQASALPEARPTLDPQPKVKRVVEPEDLIAVDVVNLGREVAQVTCQLATVGASEGGTAAELVKELGSLAAVPREDGTTATPKPKDQETRRVSARVDDGQAVCQFPGVAAGLYRLDVVAARPSVRGKAPTPQSVAAAFLPFIGRRMKVRIVLGR